MIMYQTQHRSAAALFLAAATPYRPRPDTCTARRRGLHAWLEKRRVAAAALDDFAMMSERGVARHRTHAELTCAEWLGVRPIDTAVSIRSMAQMQRNPFRTLVVCGLWLLLGFIGATALAAGLLQLFEGGPRWMWASALAASGGAGVHRFGAVAGSISNLPGRCRPAPGRIRRADLARTFHPTQRVPRDLRHFAAIQP